MDFTNHKPQALYPLLPTQRERDGERDDGSRKERGDVFYMSAVGRGFQKLKKKKRPTG